MPLRLAILLVTAVGVSAQDSAKTVLLNVQAGQVPPDTGLETQTKFEIVEKVKELPGKALKVSLAAGDSFGSRGSVQQNWKKHAFFRFDAFNPGTDPIALELTVIHARSSSYQTRVVVPFKLKPGKTEVKLGIDEMTNVNGSAPDLSKVSKWYINDPAKKASTFYLGDIWLEGGDVPAAPAPGSGPAPPPAGYRIKGKIGNQDVDLTVTPITGAGAPAAKSTVTGDPARLARIKAAKMPAITRPTMFDTPEADAILSALEVFPPDNPWNLLVDDWPVHPNSKAIVGTIGPEKPFRYNPDMGFVLVPPDLKKVDVKLTSYTGESDKGPFPVPDNVPIEGWPVDFQRNPATKGLTLDDVQRGKPNREADRHGIVVDPTNRMLYEFYRLTRTDAGWAADQSSVFDLKSNKLRPEGWTSSDAAGLPIFPSVVRYDELKRGAVEHALRVSVRKSRRAYVYPATHFASRLTDENLPRMGERLRLRKDFDVSGFSPEVKAILVALKRYGMFVADNGIEWAISVAPDPRIPDLHEELRKVKG
ncbi:MAG TPA: hypothetical protein VH120_16015, partial [Gemmataceae bacterium]|nr:hypothetical protein [Gemmataceae bacterium]